MVGEMTAIVSLCENRDLSIVLFGEASIRWDNQWEKDPYKVLLHCASLVYQSFTNALLAKMISSH